MKINEKWLLFSISTIAVIFGITDHLMKGTVATDDTQNVIINDTANNKENNNVVDENELDGDYIIRESDDYLESVTFSEGTIEFDTNVYEYWIDVKNFKRLEIYPVLASDYDSYSVKKESSDNEYKVIITVTKPDGSFKDYTFHVNQVKENINIDTEEVMVEKKNYTPVFITIICVLILINVYRIIKYKKNKNIDA